MKTNATTTRTATQNAAPEAASFNPAAMLPAQNFGDLCFDYFGKGSVIVFGNVPDHVQQLEALGGRFSFNLHYSPLQNGRKWSRKMETTRGYYFTSEKSKREAVAYVRAVNNALFDKYTAAARGVDLSRQTPADFKAGDRVRTIHGAGTVTEHTPQNNAARSVVVKLDKFTYNYGWQGMPHTFIEVSTAEVVHYTEPAKSEPAAPTAQECAARLKSAKAHAVAFRFGADVQICVKQSRNFWNLSNGDGRGTQYGLTTDEAAEVLALIAADDLKKGAKAETITRTADGIDKTADGLEFRAVVVGVESGEIEAAFFTQEEAQAAGYYGNQLEADPAAWCKGSEGYRGGRLLLECCREEDAGTNNIAYGDTSEKAAANYRAGRFGLAEVMSKTSAAPCYSAAEKSEPTAQERDEIGAAYIMEGGQLIKAEESKTSVFCGFYAACGYNGQKAGDLFAVLSGPILAPAYNAVGHRLNAGASRAGMSYSRTNRKWYKE